MILARVLGNMVATEKEACYAGRKLLWVQPITPEGAEVGSAFLTFDAVGAGEGETVIVLMEGSGAQQLLKAKNLPFSCLVIGIVDRIDLPKVAEG